MPRHFPVTEIDLLTDEEEDIVRMIYDRLLPKGELKRHGKTTPTMLLRLQMIKHEVEEAISEAMHEILFNRETELHIEALVRVRDYCEREMDGGS